MNQSQNNLSPYLYLCCFLLSLLFLIVLIKKKKRERETSLVGQWLRLSTPNAGGPGLLPGQGTRTVHAAVKSSHASTRSSHATTKTQDSQIKIKHACARTHTQRKPLINILRKNKYCWFPYIQCAHNKWLTITFGKMVYILPNRQHSNICCSWQLQVRFLTEHWFYVLAWEDADTEIPCFKYTFLYISI